MTQRSPNLNVFISLTSFLVILACSEETGVSDTQAPPPDINNVAQAEGVDAVYTNGRIYTLDDDMPWAEAIAVQDGAIRSIGSHSDVVALTGSNTISYDLDGRMVMPGIHDTHAHPVDAGLTALYECSFRTNVLSEALEIIQGCIAEAEPGAWIIGGQWSDAYFQGDTLPKTILDELTTDNPVFFMDWSVHNAWVNSKALEMLNITAESPDPDGGVIVKDLTSGEPTGILYDNAAYNSRHEMPKYSKQQYMDALKWSIDQMIRYGVTTFKDAITTEETLAAYLALDEAGELKARAKTSLSWKSAWAYSHESEIKTIDTRPGVTSEFLDTDFAKIMLDGIPPTYTSALIEPYMPSERFGDNFTGKTMLEPDELIEDVVALDAKGVTVKIHATGDRSVRMALDAYTATRAANGDTGLIHEISHAETIHPDDLLRFAALNVAPEMCPIFWYPAALGDMSPILGEERSKFWQIKSLDDSGAIVIYGSDWPVVPEPNPWPGIEAMVTRMDPTGNDPVVGWIEEAVDLETAIRIFTLNSATTNKDSDSSGSLMTGKEADFIVLDRNIFDIPIEDVGDTQVELTVVNGKHVYGDL